MLASLNVEYSYNASNSFRFPDIHCSRGEQWLIMGASGSGKTTLLHLLGGLLRPDKGSIRINDAEITSFSSARLDAFRGKEIGIVFQTPHFIQSLNVEENLFLTRSLNGLNKDRQQVVQLLKKLNISDKCKNKPRELSQGELQRLSIARAVINSPSLILADEPTSSLDDHNCEEAISLLKEQAGSTGSSLLIVTHDHRLKNHFSHVINLQK